MSHPHEPSGPPSDDDHWFRPAQAGRGDEPIYRESEYAPAQDAVNALQDLGRPAQEAAETSVDLVKASYGDSEELPVTGGRPVDDEEKEPRTGWRRYIPSWKIVVGTLAFMFLGFGTLIGVGYAKTPIPDPNAEAQQEAAIFYYADGRTEIARIGRNREIVPISKIPGPVRTAVLAAENRSFYSDKGVSPTGVGRAALKNLTGGETQGGSTITQQLAKNYYLSPEQTVQRKFKELFISVKLGNRMTKDEILATYLNTIFFGRNAYGIQAAAKVYFKKDVAKLNVGEGALLAAMIQQPGNFEPTGPNRQALFERYQWVLKGMTEMGELDPATAAEYQAKMPKVEKLNARNILGGHKGYMIERAKLELSRQWGDKSLADTEKKIVDNGLRIVTTFDSALMASAAKAFQTALPGTDMKKLALKQKIGAGLISVDTGNGEVRAFYGGPDYLRQQYDTVWQGSAQAGSSFKPYVLAAALKNGMSLKTLVEGRSPLCIDGEGKVVSRGTPGCYLVPNSHEGGPPVVNLVTATAQSTNTAYVQLGLKVGLDKVNDIAVSAGIATTQLEPHDDVGGFSLGIADVRPVEQAAGYAPFANGGTYHQPHVVRKVFQSDGKTQYGSALKWDKHKVFEPSVAADATYALQQVVRSGTATSARLADGRPVAGKTGTTDKNVATWFVGYVPQLSTAVTMYTTKKNKDKTRQTLSLPGYGVVYGGAVPAKVWHNFMTDATAKLKAEQFPQPAYNGVSEIFASAPPKTKTPTCKPHEMVDDKCPPPGQEPEQPDEPDNGQGCDQFMQPLGCNPAVPPPGQEDAPEQWFCDRNPDYEYCKKDDPGEQPGQPGNDADHDGVPDDQDDDDDNDGIKDWDEQQPEQPARALPATRRTG